MDARSIEKYLSYGSKYNLKTLEITKDVVKIEFRAPVRKTEAQLPIDPEVLKKVREYAKKQAENLELDELQILNPEAYEDRLANADT